MLEKSKPFDYPKGWGKELWIQNNSKYCGKILCFNKGGRSSMHYHLEKEETWYVVSGKFLIEYLDTGTAEKMSLEVGVGDTVDIPRGLPHRLIALEKGEIFEISTSHSDDDSYRIEKGDSQK